MNIAQKPTFVLGQRHLLGIEGLSREEILGLLDLAEHFVDLNRQIEKKQSSLRGRTLINLFFEVSTRTQASFGFVPVGSTPEAFAALIKADVERGNRIVREAGIKVE